MKSFEQRLIFFPEREIARSPAGPFEDVFFEMLDGTRLHGWWLPFPDARGALILSHGNACNIGDRAAVGDFLRDELGINVLMYDYRGYGRSEGSPTEQGTYSDIRGAFAYVLSRGFQPESVVLMGQSLGTAVTIDLAADQKTGAVILEAAFTSIEAMRRTLWWSLPIRGMITTKYDALSKIVRVQSPIAMIHATGDAAIPFAMGRELFEAAKAPKRFFEVRADVHEGAILRLGMEELRRLKEFLLAPGH